MECCLCCYLLLQMSDSPLLYVRRTTCTCSYNRVKVEQKLCSVGF
jgi:hypothetical protein